VVLDPLARDLHGLVEVALLEVPRGEDVAAVRGVDDGARAEAFHALAEHRVVLEELADLFRVLPELVGILHLELALARDTHGLEALRAHHRAHARAPRNALVRDDPGIENGVLTRRPDDRVVRLPAQLALGLVGALAPQVRSVEELHRIGLAVDLEPHRRRRFALHHQDVDPRLLHAQGEGAPAGGVSDPPGERALADHRKPVGLGGDRPVQRTRGEDQQVLRAERVDARAGAVVQEPRPVPLSADVEPRDLLVEGLKRERPRGEIHLEDAAGVSLDHAGLPSSGFDSAA
jgi:hypothetical protein